MKVDYTNISKTYDNYRSYPEILIKRIIRCGEINQGKRILDLGCGTGNVALQLLEVIDLNIIGADISIPMLEVARKKSLDVIRADANNTGLPFLDNSFDTVMGVYIIHQIKSLTSLFSECFRILRKGTLVLLTSSHAQIERQHPVIKQFFPSFISIDKNRFPDIHRVDNLLNAAGFRDIKHEEVRGGSIPLDDEYLRKVKGKHISTYQLLPQREFESGVEKLEAFIENIRQPEFREWRGTLIYGRKKE